MPSHADFLIERLENTGIKHVFGLCGDYILNFFDRLSQSKKIKLINNTDEEGAGFAADGYARSFGVGCVAVTYSVGALKLCNPIAGAYAEKSPVIVISGSPGVEEHDDNFLMHHMVSSKCQREVFKNITCAQAILDNPTTAGYQIDEAFEKLRYYKQPIYIELPRDVSLKSINYDVYTLGTPKSPETDLHNLEDSIKEVADWIEESKNPVILAGVEVARYGLGKDLLKFAQKHNIPVASTVLSKSVVDEVHPLYAGVYAGSNSSQDHVRELVENSDCLLVCGEVITEATVGYRSSKAFQKREMVTCTINGLQVRNHNYPNVSFNDFCNTLFKTTLSTKSLVLQPKNTQNEFTFRDDAKLTILRVFKKIDSILDENKVVIADVGDSILGAIDLLNMRYANSFYAPAFYLSMGFAIPAALGISLSRPNVRPIVIVGDGAFQMSSSEISTMFKNKLKPIIVVLNNGGYATERFILDGDFNNITNWDYHLITEMIGGGFGMKVETEEELNNAMDLALESEVVSILNCAIDKEDVSPALRRISDTLAKKVK